MVKINCQLSTHAIKAKGTRYLGGGGLVGVRSTIRSDPMGGGAFRQRSDPRSGSKSATIRIKKCTFQFLNNTTNPWYF